MPLADALLHRLFCVQKDNPVTLENRNGHYKK